jgi:membrane protein implicated in regulation of membrane protease activity
MIRFLTESATAVLVGLEAFLLGFGAIWMVLSAVFTVNAWLIPALVAGALSAIVATFAMLRLARAAAHNEQRLIDAAAVD